MDYVITIAIVLIAIISIILVWINLPGTFVLLVSIFCIDRFTDYQELPENFLITMLIVFMLLEVIEFLLSAVMVKFQGGKNSSAFLSILGAIVGAIIGSFILPIIGTFLGLIIGSYLVTYYNEKNLGKNSQEATQIAISTTLGYLIGKSMKSLLIAIFVLYLII